jgi:BppU N-terminal domain
LLKKFTVNLDIEQQPSNNAIFVNSNDSNSFNLTLNILESAVAKNLTGITSANLDIMKPDGTTVATACTITNATAGILTVTVAQSFYPLLGQYKALVKITDSDGSIATTNSFVFVVQAGW